MKRWRIGLGLMGWEGEALNIDRMCWGFGLSRAQVWGEEDGRGCSVGMILRLVPWLGIGRRR